MDAITIILVLSKMFWFFFLPVTVTFASLAFLETCCRLKAEDGELGDSWESPLCWDILSSVSGNESSLWRSFHFKTLHIKARMQNIHRTTELF